MAQINSILHKINYVFFYIFTFALLFHIFLSLYIKRFSLYVFLASLPPFHTDLRKLCSFRCAARVLKMSIIHWGHLCCVCVLFLLRNYPRKEPKKKKQTKIKKQLRAHATFTKASNTPKNKVNKREKVWKIIIILIKQREKGRKRKKKREREIVKQISDEWKKKEPTKWWAQCHPGTYTTAFRTIHINLNNNTKASSNN